MTNEDDDIAFPLPLFLLTPLTPEPQNSFYLHWSKPEAVSDGYPVHPGDCSASFPPRLQDRLKVFTPVASNIRNPAPVNRFSSSHGRPCINILTGEIIRMPLKFLDLDPFSVLQSHHLRDFSLRNCFSSLHCLPPVTNYLKTGFFPFV